MSWFNQEKFSKENIIGDHYLFTILDLILPLLKLNYV